MKEAFSNYFQQLYIDTALQIMTLMSNSQQYLSFYQSFFAPMLSKHLFWFWNSDVTCFSLHWYLEKVHFKKKRFVLQNSSKIVFVVNCFSLLLFCYKSKSWHALLQMSFGSFLKLITKTIKAHSRKFLIAHYTTLFE